VQHISRDLQQTQALLRDLREAKLDQDQKLTQLDQLYRESTGQSRALQGRVTGLAKTLKQVRQGINLQRGHRQNFAS
jgi:ABC-type transporter Mla subunit MlaD